MYDAPGRPGNLWKIWSQTSPPLPWLQSPLGNPYSSPHLLPHTLLYLILTYYILHLVISYYLLHYDTRLFFLLCLKIISLIIHSYYIWLLLLLWLLSLLLLLLLFHIHFVCSDWHQFWEMMKSECPLPGWSKVCWIEAMIVGGDRRTLGGPWASIATSVCHVALLQRFVFRSTKAIQML